MEKRMCQGDASLDLPYTDDEGGQSKSTKFVFRKNKSSDIEHQIVQQDYYDNFKAIVKDVISGFDIRTKDIIMSRYLLDTKATLQDLAAKYNISAERVRQIEEEALTKLKKAIKNRS
ncbi:sigma factor-like helix-turn-helix DNA-binding protein [Francisella noatunensis]